MRWNLGLIIFLLFVVWQVVTAILNQINANKQQQQAEELAKRRREAAGTTTAEGNGAGGGRSRIDDLAARRKAQLEELRQRREAGRSAQTTQARVGGPASGTAGSTGVADPKASRQRTIRTEPIGRERKPDPWQARKQEAQRREQEAKRVQAQRAAQTRAAQQAQQQQLAARERMAQQQQAAMRAAAQAEKAAAAEATSIPPGSIAHAIRRRFSDPEQLREAFILKELLDQPVSIRREQLG